MEDGSGVKEDTARKEDVKEGEVEFLVVVYKIEECLAYFFGLFHPDIKNAQNHFHQK